MTHRFVTVGADEYEFAPDDAPAIGQRWFALATAQLLDEITENPIRTAFTVRVITSGISAKTGTDGTFALVARPWTRFPPLPGPRPHVVVRVSAAGYIDRTIDFTMPFDARTVTVVASAGSSVVTLSSVAALSANQMLVLGTGTAQEFTQIAALGPGASDVTLTAPLRFTHGLGDTAIAATAAPVLVSLHRVPVKFRGRVVRIGVGGAPSTAVPNAAITIADFWRTQRDVRNRPFVGAVPVGEMTGPMPRHYPLSLGQGLIAPRPAGATAVNVTPLSSSSGDEKRLLVAAASDQNTVRLSDRFNLTGTSLVRIDAGDTERSEIHTVDTMMPLAFPDTQPSTIKLHHPLVAAHAPGARVERVTTPLGPPAPLGALDAAEISDRTLLTDQVPPASVTHAQVSSAGIDDEFHDCSAYSTQADSSGYFSLPVLHRVAQVRLDVKDGATTRQFYVEPEYGATEQWLDLTIP